MPPFTMFRHVMRLLYHWPSGAQSYICPECFRLVVVRWLDNAAHEKIVLDAGAADVPHTMLREQPNTAPAQAPEPEADEQQPGDDLSLWRDGLSDIDGL